MRILGIERDKSACNYYRVLQPLSKLDEHKFAEVQMLQESNLGSEHAMGMALWADIIVFQRPSTEAWFNFIKICRKIGKLIVSDYDDDPFNTSPLNPYYAWIGTEEVAWQWPDGTKEMLWSDGMTSKAGQKIFSIEENINHRDMFRVNFKKSDIVTCTTPILRESFLKINPNVAVLPNVVDPAFFPSGYKMVKSEKEIRIGWQGGVSHYEDLYMIKDVINKTLRNNPNVKFIYFGDIRFLGLFKDCPQDQVEYHPWVNHSTYPYKMALMNLDIALCPIIDNVFNRNKSAIKWMEYSLVKAATIASDIPPYSEVIENGKTGLLVKDDQWESALQTLIDNKSTRLELASNAETIVRQDHNADKSAHIWFEAYERLMKGEEVKT